MAVPIEFVLGAGLYILMLIGIAMPQLRMLKYAGAMGVLVFGVIILFPGIPGIDRSGLMALAIGTISIGLGLFFLIEDAFSFDRQVDSFDQADDGRFHG